MFLSEAMASRHPTAANRVAAILACAAAFGLFATSAVAGEALSFTNESFFSHNGVILGAASHRPIGSGFVVGTQKVVVTTWHVFQGASAQYNETNLLFLSGREVHSLRPMAALPSFDLALFSPTPEVAGAPFYPGDFNKVNAGDTILYVGYDIRGPAPDKTNDFPIAYGRATVESKALVNFHGSRIDALLFRGEAIPGYSGGAVYNTNMEIVGVIAGWGPQKLNAAYSIAPIVELVSTPWFTNIQPRKAQLSR